mmetsp:Transcript_53884/g.114485  ORF Transcript_53884/g.114485 Transcript_53884/m.114485 type:complete len:115 (-) Transcript_53884:37-381(-)
MRDAASEDKVGSEATAGDASVAQVRSRGHGHTASTGKRRKMPATGGSADVTVPISKRSRLTDDGTYEIVTTDDEGRERISTSHAFVTQNEVTGPISTSDDVSVAQMEGAPDVTL